MNLLCICSKKIWKNTIERVQLLVVWQVSNLQFKLPSPSLMFFQIFWQQVQSCFFVEFGVVILKEKKYALFGKFWPHVRSTPWIYSTLRKFSLCIVYNFKIACNFKFWYSDQMFKIWKICAWATRGNYLQISWHGTNWYLTLRIHFDRVYR